MGDDDRTVELEIGCHFYGWRIGCFRLRMLQSDVEKAERAGMEGGENSREEGGKVAEVEVDENDADHDLTAVGAIV